MDKMKAKILQEMADEKSLIDFKARLFEELDAIPGKGTYHQIPHVEYQRADKQRRNDRRRLNHKAKSYARGYGAGNAASLTDKTVRICHKGNMVYFDLGEGTFHEVPKKTYYSEIAEMRRYNGERKRHEYMVASSKSTLHRMADEAYAEEHADDDLPNEVLEELPGDVCEEYDYVEDMGISSKSSHPAMREKADTIVKKIAEMMPEELSDNQKAIIYTPVVGDETIAVVILIGPSEKLPFIPNAVKVSGN